MENDSDLTEVLMDVKGLKCPLPVLRASKVLRSLDNGSVLKVLCTDPNAVTDFKAFCEMSGHDLINYVENSGVYEFFIQPAS